jgi:TolB-like protein
MGSALRSVEQTKQTVRRPILRQIAVGVAILTLAIGGTVLWVGWKHGTVKPVEVSNTRDESLADAPAIAVLPFANMSGDPNMAYFADGVTETMTAGLSRSPEVRVVARTSAEAYKDKALDARQIGQELGARYLLEGSVQKESDRVRIVAQLIDAATGDHVWAERYEGEGTDAFALQDVRRADLRSRRSRRRLSARGGRSPASAGPLPPTARPLPCADQTKDLRSWVTRRARKSPSRLECPSSTVVRGR